jgi:FkbM family methyltransferase
VGPDEGAAYLFPTTSLGSAYDQIEPLTEGVCIDVGASFGWYTIRWAKQLGERGRVLALEPQPKHLRSLRTNLTLNALTNVLVCACAAGSHDGTLTLNVPRFGLSIYDASAVHDKGGVSIQVPLRSVDSLCDEFGLRDVRVIKIDVEGFEPEVLRGTRRVLERDRPRVVFEAMTGAALEACRFEFPAAYVICQLGEFDYLAEASI